MKHSNDDAVRLSKFLSSVLRHDPGRIGLRLDDEGWVDVDALLAAATNAGVAMSLETLFEIVASSDKKRFTLSDDRRRIRAAQGHSVAVDLGLPAIEPPTVLYHGTARAVLERVLAEGLKPMGRRHVHLSIDEATARRVGARHGKPVVLTVEAQRMFALGHAFHRADNGVWLTDQVPPEFLICTSSSSADSATTSRLAKLSM